MPQDTFILSESLKAALKDFYNRRDRIEEVIASLESTVAALSGNAVPPPQASRKSEVVKIAGKKAKGNGKGYTRADCVDVALSMIVKAGTAVSAKAVAREVERKYGKGPKVGSNLWYDAEKAKDGRLKCTGTGMYGRKDVLAARMDAKTEKVLEQARTNAERSKEIARS